MELDEIDKEIINALSIDGRQSLSKIGEFLEESIEVSMSHTGVRKRLNKLKINEVLNIQGNVNIKVLQYKAAFVLMEMKNFELVKKIIECYRDCPRVFFIAQISGQYNLILGFLGRDIDVLHRYLNHCGPTNNDGILHSAILFVSNFETPQNFPLSIFKKENSTLKCGNVCKNCAAFTDGTCPGCGHF